MIWRKSIKYNTINLPCLLVIDAYGFPGSPNAHFYNNFSRAWNHIVQRYNGCMHETVYHKPVKFWLSRIPPPPPQGEIIHSTSIV